jgi:hypothetical protein
LNGQVLYLRMFGEYSTSTLNVELVVAFDLRVFSPHLHVTYQRVFFS